MQTKTLQKIIDRVVYGAAIDGQVATTGRHSTTALVDMFNEVWDSLLNMAATNGQVEALEETAALPLGAIATGEEFIQVAWPDTALEIHGVDVFTGGSEGWTDLDPIRWSSRRVTKQCPDRLGYWSVKKLPKESGASVTAGVLAVFPANLSGMLAKVYYREPWLPISVANIATFIVIGYPDWFQWAINSMIMQITQRDTNKKDNFAAAKLLKDEAQANIEKTSRRRQVSGPRVPRRRDGQDL